MYDLIAAMPQQEQLEALGFRVAPHPSTVHIWYRTIFLFRDLKKISVKTVIEERSFGRRRSRSVKRWGKRVVLVMSKNKQNLN